MGDPWEAGAVARCPVCNKEVVVSPQAGETVGMCVCRGKWGVGEGCSRRLGSLAGQQGVELGAWEILWGFQAPLGIVDLWGWGGRLEVAGERQGSWGPEASIVRVA